MWDVVCCYKVGNLMLYDVGRRMLYQIVNRMLYHVGCGVLLRSWKSYVVQCGMLFDVGSGMLVFFSNVEPKWYVVIVLRGML